MGVFTINNTTKSLAWLIALIVVTLNLKLVYETALEWIMSAESFFVKSLIVTGEVILVLLLLVTIVYPFILKRKEKQINIHRDLAMDELKNLRAQPFKKIALALDFSAKDKSVIEYTLQFAQKNTELVLIHIVESASAKLIGAETEDYETRQDKERLLEYVAFFRKKDLAADAKIGYRNRTKEIARIVRESGADLLILGSHGHKGFKDLVWGETINRVRHLIDIPVFIAR